MSGAEALRCFAQCPQKTCKLSQAFGLERDELCSLNCNWVPVVLGGCNDCDLLRSCSNCFCCTQTGMLCSLFHLLKGKLFCIGRLWLLEFDIYGSGEEADIDCWMFSSC